MKPFGTLNIFPQHLNLDDLTAPSFFLSGMSKLSGNAEFIILEKQETVENSPPRCRQTLTLSFRRHLRQLKCGLLNVMNL